LLQVFTLQLKVVVQVEVKVLLEVELEAVMEVMTLILLTMFPEQVQIQQLVMMVL